jgi:hypothetical protein
MPVKTRKHSKKSHKRRTLRRIPRRAKKGGADSQALTPPDSSFGAKIGAPVNSDNAWHKIA